MRSEGFAFTFICCPAAPLVRKDRFESYFGGPYVELGRLLYHKLFGEMEPVDEEMFLSSLTLLRRVTTVELGGEQHEAEAFCFTVFSESSDGVDRASEQEGVGKKARMKFHFDEGGGERCGFFRSPMQLC